MVDANVGGPPRVKTPTFIKQEEAFNDAKAKFYAGDIDVAEWKTLKRKFSGQRRKFKATADKKRFGA